MLEVLILNKYENKLFFQDVGRLFYLNIFQLKIFEKWQFNFNFRFKKKSNLVFIQNKSNLKKNLK